MGKIMSWAGERRQVHHSIEMACDANLNGGIAFL